MSLSFAPVALAETAKFKQQILPLECVFEIVDYGTGEIRFLTPEECGQIIPQPQPPEKTPRRLPASSNKKFVSSESALFYPGVASDGAIPSSSNAVNLDRYKNFRTREGQSIQVRVGYTYYFRELSGKNASPITVSVYIKAITPRYVRYVMNDGREKVVYIQQTQLYDTDKDSYADFAVGLVATNPPGTATMYFRFFQDSVDPSVPAPRVKQDPTIAYATVVVAAALAAQRWWRLRKNS